MGSERRPPTKATPRWTAVRSAPAITEADDAVAGVAPFEDFARDLDRRLARSDYQNPLPDVWVSEEPVRADAPGDHQQERQRQRYQRDAAPDHQRRHEVHHNR